MATSQTAKQRAYQARRLEQSADLRLAIVSWIADYEDQHKYGPSVTELGNRFDRTRSTIWGHLVRLREAGLVDWVDGQPRTLHVAQHIDTNPDSVL